MDDYGSGESLEASAADASIASGFGSIIDGVVDVASSAGDAALNAAYDVGDTAQGMYHSTLAAGDAFVGDMAGANAENALADEERRQIQEDDANIARDIGF